MRSQRLKDLYYLTAGRLSIVSYGWNRLRAGRFRDKYVHVGCGPDYVEGMINVDGNLFRKKDLWLDVTLGLPFADNSVEGIYTSHMIERLSTFVAASAVTHGDPTRLGFLCPRPPACTGVREGSRFPAAMRPADAPEEHPAEHHSFALRRVYFWVLHCQLKLPAA